MKGRSIVVLLALALGACRQHETSEVIPSAVEVATAREISPDAGVRYSATVEPDAQTALGFRVGGYVEEVAVDAGDQVTKGAVLARIRRSDYVEKLGQAAAQQQQAEAALGQAKTDLDRAKTLFAANALTKPELDAAVARFEAYTAQVKGGRALSSEAGITLGDTTLTAPMDGVILSRSIERGDLAAPGKPAFVLANTRTVKVIVGVPDTMIGTFKIGQPMDVSTESMPGRAFQASVARIAPAADPKSRSFDIELHIANPANELKPGMVASLEIAHGNAKLLAVPLAAVIRPPQSSDGYAVYVVSGDKLQARRVELGEPLGNFVAVRGGLSAGERVVISGPALLVDGQSVRVVNGGSDAR